MAKTGVVILVTTVTGGIGWYLGSLIGVMTAWTLSCLGTAVGIYYAKRWVSEYLP